MSVAIGDLTLSVGTWNPTRHPEQEFCYIDLSAVDQTSKVISDASFLRGQDAPSRARQLVAAGDILVSTVRPNLNAVAPVPDEYDGATASTGFCVLRPNPEKVLSSYLMHWVRSPQFIETMVREATGASYPAVSDRIVKNSLIPLPPLPKQLRIATILDKADALRRKRKRAIELLDSLTQSTFFDLFGHTSDDLSKWGNFIPLSNLAEIGSGITKGRKLNGQPTRQVPYLAVANVQDRRLKLTGVKTIEATESEVARYRLHTDDLLLTEGGDPDKLGRGTLWAGELKEAIHQNHIFRVRLKTEAVLPLFLSWLVGSPYGKRYFLSVAKQTTGIASINKTQLSEFPTVVPPIELQRKFARLAQAVKTEMQQLISSSSNAEVLFSSLQHRALSGQL
ncbi:restriction endonuclease subunit S [Mesorhizobium sp. L-8-10]|uniref:restriction endonuclease subunit S n=1 Tax=Mesorhizobium sp. L-8-10 TaxID=2744523 RepID=UPI001FD4925A|nr:restriction endonuclease subunit S [Mesorhizobium sp. L-8-10]